MIIPLNPPLVAFDLKYHKRVYTHVRAGPIAELNMCELIDVSLTSSVYNGSSRHSFLRTRGPEGPEAPT